jgi:hypothetical protein
MLDNQNNPVKCAIPAKFEVGELVEIPAHGRTGTILMIELYTNRYLVDCYPGALGNYIYCKIRNNNEYGGLYAANWLEESELRKMTNENSQN